MAWVKPWALEPVSWGPKAGQLGPTNTHFKSEETALQPSKPNFFRRRARRPAGEVVEPGVSAPAGFRT